MNGQPLVSMITPVFNAALFLQDAIESVLAQHYGGWELLLIDDGSTDSSPEIAQAYARRYPDKIRYFTHEARENRGKSTSRNVGILHARGKYLAFLDADDVLLPQKLARQSAYLEAQPAVGMIYGRTLYWHSWLGAPKRKQKDYRSKLGVTPHRVYQPPLLLAMFLRDSGTVPCLCSLLVRRALVLEVGLFDESIQHLYEDQVLLAKLCLAAPVLVDDDTGELYRQHAGSSSNVARREGAYHPWLPDPARLRYLSWLRTYLSEQNITDATLERALHKAFAPYRSPRVNLLLLPFRYLATGMGNYLAPLVDRIRAATGSTLLDKN